MPRTADVLALLTKTGVVVGSVAAGKRDPKDVDVVVSEATRPEDRRNPVFARLATQWPDGESLGPGHWWVDADPLPVEVHCYTWHAVDPRKNAGMVSHRQARRGAAIREVCGVSMYVQRVGE